jgi:hypothetical protein
MELRPRNLKVQGIVWRRFDRVALRLRASGRSDGARSGLPARAHSDDSQRARLGPLGRRPARHDPRRARRD